MSRTVAENSTISLAGGGSRIIDVAYGAYSVGDGNPPIKTIRVREAGTRLSVLTHSLGDNMLLSTGHNISARDLVAEELLSPGGSNTYSAVTVSAGSIQLLF